MGNILCRHAIGHWQKNGDPKQVLSRLNRVVMLGPPNHGSAFASGLSKLGLFETVTGKSGLQLGPSWDSFCDSLGTPPCPFAIVVGDVSFSPVQNPYLTGPNDGVVSREEAYLEGVTEIQSFPVLHSFLMDAPAIRKATVSFLSGKALQ